MKKSEQERIRETIGEVIKKAAGDKKFRELCLKDPEQAITKITNRKFSWTKDIQFTEDKDEISERVFLLPSLRSDDELDEHLLDQITGGCSIVIAQSKIMCIE